MSNKNDSFNFEEFTVNSIRYIDSIRSYQKGGTRPTESRINAFFRAVGLPAIVPNDEKDFIDKEPDSLNNGNIHNSDFSNFKILLDERQRSYTLKIEQKEIDNFMNVNKSKINFSVSAGSKTNKRKRGVLLPMVVDGRIHIFPQLRRIGGAFMTDEELEVDSQTKYERPLIETIINVKLKGENIVDSKKQSNVSSALSSNALKDISTDIGIRLSETLNSISISLEETVRKINSTRILSGDNIRPTIENIAQRKLKILKSENNFGITDIKKFNQDSESARINSILPIFEFDDTAEDNKTKNLRGGGLTDAFINMVSSGERLKEDIMSSQRIKNKVNINIRRSFRSLDLFTGTFSAISGIDIIVTISALYRLDLVYLIGLLNSESRDRLKAAKGDLDVIKKAKSLGESRDKLEEEVVKIFDELSKNIDIAKHDDKIRNQIPKKENK